MERTVWILKRNEVIFKEGDKADCMYDIRVGTVGIYANYGMKNEKLLTELTTDQFFGEMGIIEGFPRSATAVALGDVTELTVIAKEQFEEYCRDNPEKTLLIMKNMSGRIRDLTNSYLGVCRTVAELMEAEKKGEKWSSALMKKLKRYSDHYNEAFQFASSCDLDMSGFGYYYW